MRSAKLATTLGLVNDEIALPMVAERFWKHVEKSDGCWIWTGYRNRRGYGQFGVGHSSLHPLLLAHRVSWALTYSAIPDGMFVCHHCDTPACVRPDHLFLGTCADNNADMRAKGRYACGAMCHATKLTDAAVIEIRRAYAAGECYQRELAQRFGVEQTNIGQIVRRQTWAHI